METQNLYPEVQTQLAWEMFTRIGHLLNINLEIDNIDYDPLKPGIVTVFFTANENGNTAAEKHDFAIRLADKVIDTEPKRLYMINMLAGAIWESCANPVALWPN